MVEDIRVATMTMVATKRKNVEKWARNYGTRVMQKLNAKIMDSKGLCD